MYKFVECHWVFLMLAHSSEYRYKNKSTVPDKKSDKKSLLI